MTRRQFSVWIGSSQLSLWQILQKRGRGGGGGAARSAALLKEIIKQVYWLSCRGPPLSGESTGARWQLAQCSEFFPRVSHHKSWDTIAAQSLPFQIFKKRKSREYLERRSTAITDFKLCFILRKENKNKSKTSNTVTSVRAVSMSLTITVSKSLVACGRWVAFNQSMA